MPEKEFKRLIDADITQKHREAIAWANEICEWHGREILSEVEILKKIKLAY